MASPGFALKKDWLRDLGPGLVVLGLAASVAFLLDLTGGLLSDRTATVPIAQALVLGALLVLPAAAYLYFRGRSSDPSQLGLVLLAASGTLLIAVYLYGVSSSVFFPADFLMWSETDYFNDILKLHLGYPLYSAEVNNESSYYPPGSQLLTYLLAWSIGKPTSIPVLRGLQLFYNLLTAVVAVRACRLLVELSYPGKTHLSEWRWKWIWGLALFSILFLVATNSLTNPFVHNLHNDALGQLVSVVAYYLLIEYAVSRDRRILVAMVFIPAAGFLVKQNLAVWGGIYCIYLAFLDRPLSIRRILAYGLGSFAVLSGVLLTCYLVWGEHFFYWVFYVLSKHPSSLRTGVFHLVAARAYLVICLLGGFVLIRGENSTRLLKLWSVWLLIILIAGYTGGINVMRHHLGPASLIAGIWFAAAVMRVWSTLSVTPSGAFRIEAWLRPAMILAVIPLLMLGSLGTLRKPKKSIPEDAYRYLAAIETEFERQPADETLLDVGSWVYADDGVIMKDRASPIAERGMSETGDFSGIVERLSKKQYSKILLRHFHSEGFWYDHALWPESSGVRKILERNYTEIGTIPGVPEWNARWPHYEPYEFSDISVLVPKSN